jgi:hypothetical protein
MTPRVSKLVMPFYALIVKVKTLSKMGEPKTKSNNIFVKTVPGDL